MEPVLRVYQFPTETQRRSFATPELGMRLNSAHRAFVKPESREPASVDQRCPNEQEVRPSKIVHGLLFKIEILKSHRYGDRAFLLAIILTWVLKKSGD
jgi:hypothetical protein